MVASRCGVGWDADGAAMRMRLAERGEPFADGLLRGSRPARMRADAVQEVLAIEHHGGDVTDCRDRGGAGHVVQQRDLPEELACAHPAVPTVLALDVHLALRE